MTTPQPMTTSKDLLAWSRKHYDNTADLELYDRIVDAYYSYYSELPRHRITAHWIMDSAWLGGPPHLENARFPEGWPQ